jgi:hypothetical protein
VTAEQTVGVEDALLRISGRLPGAIRFRLLNSLENFRRASCLLNIDLEMASFRAITGEEEAATALIKAIQLRRYEHAFRFNARNHLHKVAVMACVTAIAKAMGPMLQHLELVIDFDKPRIDVKVPLSTFGVNNAEDLAIQLIEPLGLVHTKPGVHEHHLYDGALAALAGEANFNSIANMAAAASNDRNKLLYASDSAMPTSKANARSIEIRQSRAFTLLVLAIMVLQSRSHLPMVRQGILAFLSIIDRLPPKVLE